MPESIALAKACLPLNHRSLPRVFSFVHGNRQRLRCLMSIWRNLPHFGKTG